MDALLSLSKFDIICENQYESVRINSQITQALFTKSTLCTGCDYKKPETKLCEWLDVPEYLSNVDF